MKGGERMEESKKFEKEMKGMREETVTKERCVNDFDTKDEIQFLKRRITTLEKEVSILFLIFSKFGKSLGINIERFGNDITIISNL
jgi:hypothetical protein